ncbi:MAG TPA: sugar ABC transporter substrate-binding protein [Actinomycetota bacterium]|nr:sugar ABC transporter substrate-binding protein [Actinomycetota bacterium]
MRRYRGRAARWLPAAAALVALAACNAGGGSEVSPETVVVWLPADNPGDIEVRQQLAERFEKAHPDIPVKVTVIPSNGYNEKVFTTVAAGNPPDIFNSGDIIIPTIVSKDYAYDLNEFIEKENYDLSVFYPEVIEGLQFQNKLVGLTDNWDTQVLYYNRDLFDRAGLEYPDGSWTWDDLRAAARALTSGQGPEKVFGVVHGTWFAPVFSAIWAHGGDILSADGKQCVMDEPPAVEAVQAIVDLIQEGVAPTPQQLEGQAPNQFMLSGRAGMIIDAGRWAAFELQETKRVDWAVAPLPRGPEGRAPFFHISMYAITKNSDSPGNAWEFLKYMVSKEAIKATVANQQGIPSRPKLATAPAFKKDELVQKHDTLEPFLASLPDVHPAPYVPNLEQYLDSMEVALQRVWTGEKPVEQGLKEACDEIEQRIAESG